MHAKNTTTTNEVRLMNIEQLCAYVGLGRTTAAEWGKQIGANIKFGKRSLYDKKIIDQALDNMKG